MHIGIKESVYDRIIKRLAEIRRQNREPEYIAVTPDEYSELKVDRRVGYYLLHTFDATVVAAEAPVTAVWETRDFELTRVSRELAPRHRPYIRTMSHEKLHGVPLFVVPPEYMPL